MTSALPMTFAVSQTKLPLGNAFIELSIPPEVRAWRMCVSFVSKKTKEETRGMQTFGKDLQGIKKCIYTAAAIIWRNRQFIPSAAKQIFKLCSETGQPVKSAQGALPCMWQSSSASSPHFSGLSLTTKDTCTQVTLVA